MTTGFKLIIIVFLLLCVSCLHAQSTNKPEVSLLEAETMLSKNISYCDSMLMRKGYVLSISDSIVLKEGSKTYTYRNRKDFRIKLTTKFDLSRTIIWDEPMSTLHLLFKEAEMFEYESSKTNSGIFDNKSQKIILIFVPKINRIKNTSSVLLTKKT